MADSHIGTSEAGKIRDWQISARLLRYIAPYRRPFFLAFLLTILNAPLATAGPLLTKAAIDLFLIPDASRPPSGYVLWIKQGVDLIGWGGSKYRGLVLIAILFLLFNLAHSMTHYFQVIITQSVGQKAIRDLRQDLFAHLHRLPMQYFDLEPAGHLLTRLTADVDAINRILNVSITVLFGEVIMTLYTLAWMFRLNWFLAMVTCFVLLTMIALSRWFRTILRPRLRNVRERLAAITAFLQEHIAGMHIVKIFNREREELGRFAHINRMHWRAAAGVTLGNAVFYPVLDTLALIGVALIVWYGGGQVAGRIIGLGSLVAFIQLAQTFYDPVTEIGSRYHAVQTALTSVERVFKLLDEPGENTGPLKPVTLGVACGRIEFRNVWFAYKPGNWVLKNVSFTVEPGEKAAFVGRTGAGKTTIANLLLRFYEIQRGEILLDNVDIRQIDSAELRSNFAVVPQEAVLFPGDVISNISLGNPSISESAIRSAAREVHLDQFIATMQNGHEIKTFQNGNGFSVGQKQLVSFARALAFDRPILILDEATSSIDSQAESLICDAVRRIMVGRTALVIAHRLSTIQSVDKIFVMHSGEIRESGDHKSLLSQHGLYWRLYQLQFCREAAPVVEIAVDASAKN